MHQHLGSPDEKIKAFYDDIEQNLDQEGIKNSLHIGDHMLKVGKDRKEDLCIGNFGAR